MRLLHRRQERTIALDESDCYAHSYGEHLLDHVDPVPADPPQPGPQIPWDLDTTPHVTTERLKRQFEERLEARRRRTHKASG